MAQPLQLLIAENSDIYCNGFSRLIKDQPGLQLLGGASNGRELLELVAVHLPHIVFIDVHLPVMDGIEACTAIKKQYPQIGVIVLTMFGNENLVADMLQAGADGYLLKNASPAELMAAAREVHAGGTYYCKAIAPVVISLLKRAANRAAFNESELAILRLICSDHTTEEMSKLLHLSTLTVETYRKKLYRKCGAKTVAGIVMYTVRNGIVKV